MIAITTMMVVATIQSSINKIVPRTSYIKMIDIWLLYSFNIIIVMMVVHTYMDSFIKRDPNDQRYLSLKFYKIWHVKLPIWEMMINYIYLSGMMAKLHFLTYLIIDNFKIILR